MDFLEQLSIQLKGKIKTQEHFNSNFKGTSYRAIKVENYRNYKIHIDEFGSLFLIQIKTESEFTLSINQPDKLSSIDRLIEVKNCPYRCYIFTESYSDFIKGHKYNPFISPDFQLFWNTFIDLVKKWNLSEDEAVAIRANGLFLIQRNNRSIIPKLTDAVELINNSKNIFKQSLKKSIFAKKVPESLKNLLPLTRKWSISDDSEREELVEKADDKEKQELIKLVAPLLNQIDEFLESFKDQPLPEEAILLGNLAELVSELKIA